MAEMYDIVAKIISQKGTCSAQHTQGQEFTIGQILPPNMCSWAFYAIFPFAATLQFGGSFPWEEEGKATVACPDAKNPVVFELRRVST